MGDLKNFLQNFWSNKGQYVFISLLIAKVCAFLGSLYVIRLLPESDFGILSIIASIFAVFAPFSGFGSMQSLLRFGSISKDQKQKEQLSAYLLRNGFLYQILLSIIFLIAGIFYIGTYKNIFILFICFSIRLIGFYFFSHILSEFRINGENKNFARVNNIINITTLILLFVLTYFFGLIGYVVANTISPFISLFWVKKFRLNKITENFSFNKKELWSYGLHSSGTALLSDTLFSIDVLILSILSNENVVANYKVAILIPSNITFIALTFMQSDFTVIAKNYLDKNFLKNYIFNYYKIFIPLCLLIVLIGYALRYEILYILFSEKYSDNTFSFTVLLVAFCMNMLFRNLYGNILSAVGMMKANTFVSVLSLILLIVLSFAFVPDFGIKAMVLATSSTLIFSGFLLMLLFYVYLKKLK